MVGKQPDFAEGLAGATARRNVYVEIDDLLGRLTGARDPKINMAIFVLALDPRASVNMDLKRHPLVGHEWKAVTSWGKKGFRIGDSLRVQTIRREPSILKFDIEALAEITALLEGKIRSVGCRAGARVIHLRKAAQIRV